MNLQNLIKYQIDLDGRIYEEHGLVGKDLISEKKLALQVELAELANATRCFKYWSKKPPMARKDILEEYVDCLHFFLSLGISLDIFPIRKKYSFQSEINDNIIEPLTKLIAGVSTITNERNWALWFSKFLDIGMSLGFTDEEVEQAYIEKNMKNHERQNNGY